jgi:predicted kinase
MEVQAERIIIANTNTTEKEMQPYVDLAEQFGYRIFSVIVETRHDGKNNHNVPENTLDKMRERFNLKL